MTDTRVFPGLWDMVLWKADFGHLVAIGIIVNTAMGAGLWWFVVRKWKG